jgi:small-conductance mechanosensitive channel
VVLLGSIKGFDMNEFLRIIENLWDTVVFKSSGHPLTVGILITLLGAFIGTIVVVSILRKVIVRNLVKKFHIEPGALYSVSTIVQYVIGIIAFIVILRTSGIDTSALTVIFGAFSVGIGFGLQNIVNNLVSGVVILIERPVKVGDRIEVGELEGDIVAISLRATTVMTNEGIAVIVPNSQFITSQVVNRSLQDRRIRFKIPVGVAYASDPEHVREVLLKAAVTHHGVLTDPEPMVIFEQFGDSSLNFFLWVWTEEYINRPNIFRSELNFAIHKALKEARITVAFPQRDVHLDSETINVRVLPNS